MFVIVDDHGTIPIYFWKESSIGPLVVHSIGSAMIFKDVPSAKKVLDRQSYPNGSPSFDFRVAELTHKPQ